MRTLFLALMCAAMVFLGCVPIAQYQCRGGESGAQDWHTVEARGIDIARKDNGFGECRTLARESTIAVEYAAERSERWFCEGYIQSPLRFKPWDKIVSTVRRGTMEFDVSGDETLLGTIVQSNVGGVGLNQPTTTQTVKRDLTERFRWILSLDALKAFSTSNGPWRAIQRDNKNDHAIVAHCWSSHVDAPNMSMWPLDNSEDFPGPNCFDWSPSEAKFVEVTRDGPRFTCTKELQAHHLEESSDGVKERGSMFFPVLSRRHLCGPISHAESGIEAALRKEAGTNYHLVGYGGACWEMGKPKPPNPGTWSGHNGAWSG